MHLCLGVEAWRTCSIPGGIYTRTNFRMYSSRNTFLFETFHSTWNRLLVALVPARSAVGEFAAILEVFSKWRTTVGTVLAGEDPKILVRIVELASTEGGISQRELQQELKINQPRLSKLTKRLVSARWVVVRKSSADRRVLLMRSTDHARTRVEWLRKELSAVSVVMVPTPPRTAAKTRKALRAHPDQESLL